MSDARALPGVRFVRPEGLHVTLKFLGEVSAERAAQTVEALRGVRASPFELELRGTGFFPNEKRPRIFWAGLDADPAQALAQLAAQVDDACAATGFPPEQRPFQPHVTLARLGSGNPRARSGPVLPAASRFPAPPDSFGMVRATHFHLYESRLHPKGAFYSKLHSFALAS